MRAHNHSYRRIRFIWLIGGVSMSAALVAMWLFLFVFPMQEQCGAMIEQRARIQGLREKAAELDGQLIFSRNKASQWREMASECQQKSGVGHDLGGFLQWIDQEAEAAELTIRDFRPSERQAAGGHQGTRVELNGLGSYPAICEFLNRLRNCPSMHRVTHVQILPRDPGHEELTINLHVLLISHPT